MKSFYLTDAGKVRDHNEDSVLIVHNNDNDILMAIADGMGGHRAGEVASSIAISHLAKDFNENFHNMSKMDAVNFLRDSVNEINDSIFRHEKTHPESKGMGTTLVTAIITKEYILFGNIGDSSGFVMKDNKLHKVTYDHTLVNLLVSAGELTKEEARERGLDVDYEGFKVKFLEHQEKSRTASKGKFKGGLSGNSEIETKYHTATHLLNAALKVVLGPDVHQRGSNITSERMRFDFSCDHKLTPEEKEQVENVVNEWIQEGLEVRVETMSKEEALKIGAEAMFIEKYPDMVTVYFIGDVSKELCGGPHVKNTKELGHFKIKKEEASSAGVRRIKAVLE